MMNTTITINHHPKSPAHPSSLFPQISQSKTLKHLSQFHAHFIKTNLINDPLAAAEILKFLSLSTPRNPHYVHAFFSQIQNPNCFAYNTIIRYFAESQDFHNEFDNPIHSIFYFRRMCEGGVVKPNNFTFPSVLKACAQLGRLEEGRQVHGLVVKLGFERDGFVVSNLVRLYVLCGVMEDARVLLLRAVDTFVGDKTRQEGIVVMYNVMIDGCVRIGDLSAARKLFDEMPERSFVSWNVMVSGYAQRGFFKEAIEMFHDMQLSDVSPNYVTLVSVLPAISRLGMLELGKWVHLYAEKNGIEIDDVLGSALVDMYTKCGTIEKAIQTFECVSNKNNAVTWSALIGGLAIHGQVQHALDYFARMQQAGVTPSDTVYIGLLSACSHAGLVEEGRSIFNHMINEVGLEPRIEHYGCMIDLLGRAGLLEEAQHLIQAMPMTPDDVIWKSLLGACTMHGNIEMGERIASILMNLFPDDSGSYVALSNMFATKENWEGVAKVRLKMKEMDIKKDPGCSYIELDGVVHEFVVEDESHYRAKEIRLMLETLSNTLKLVDCPNTK